MKTRAVVVGPIAGLIAWGCSVDKPAPPAVNTTLQGSARIDPARLEAIARQYESWERIDDAAYWTQTLCNPELQTKDPGDARFSASDDAATHGGKLFFVYAKNRDAYAITLDKPQPEGQVIVKQAFAPREVESGIDNRTGGPQAFAPSPPDPRDSNLRFDWMKIHLTENPPRPAVKDGKYYGPGEPLALFIMVKGRTDDPGTDRGWLYATTSMDGRIVYTNGLVSSCIQCHADAPHDRLFGLQDVKPASVKPK